MSSSRSSASATGVIILAAGQGKRMLSSLPKVLHEIGGQPLVFHILNRVLEVSPGSSVALVVGHGRERVEEAVRKEPRFAQLDVTFVHQVEQKGTGHAARSAMDSDWGKKCVARKCNILVLPGDLPVLPNELIAQMLAPLGKTEALRLLTCELPNPTGYGRIVRRGKTGPVLRISEEKDATLREKEIREVGASIYSFQASFLQYGLQRLSNKNAQGEYYLTDLIAQAARAKKKIDVLRWHEPTDVRGVNDPWELAQARRILNERCVRDWALKGVKFTDPTTAWIDLTVELGKDVVVCPGTLLQGTTRVAEGAIIGARTVLNNVEVGAGANIKTGTVAEDSTIGAGAQVGPYAHLRPGSIVGAGAKIGNFVELKKARIGEKTSIAHLSYVGDAEVGKNVNIGCGFVTCNFDGRVIDGSRKHKTVIEDDVFLGSDCQVIAPIRIGRGAYVASGSTVTQDVEPDALAVARSRQVNKPGYAKKLRDAK
jgi:bifunctional UDP-N-acetylglucosamine pyrophosphorylase/glucosamine-1-phosphate N-acetyltransferase